MAKKQKKPKNRNPIAKAVKNIRPQVKPDKKKNPVITYNSNPLYGE